MTDDTELHVDGNAAGGVLAEIFTPEATAAVVTCAGCGKAGAVGTALVYDHCPGLVMRCPGCSAVLMRFAHTRDVLVADFRGVETMVFRPAG